MSVKLEMEWFETTEKQHPDKPGLKRYEHVYCMVNRKHYGIEVLAWNCEHLTWDDADGDDHCCDATEVTGWGVLPDPPKVTP